MSINNRHIALPMFAIFALISAILLVSPPSSQSQSDLPHSGQWRIAGQNLSDSRSQPEEHSISPTNVNGLTQKWVFTTGGDVSATPTVDGNAVYFPDWGGNLFAVDRETGTIRWMTQVETHPAAIITGSPVIFDGVVYIGVSSNEETLALDPTYPCCSFRGSIVALDAKTGAMLWKTFDMPDNGGKPGGYSGGAMWQSPAIDPKRGTLFAGTGNNYTAPADVEACQNATPTADCAAPDDFFDTALALDLKTGQIKWAKRLQNLDTFTGACGFGTARPPSGTPNCPVPSSEDFDFGGAGPNLVGKIVGFGQKSGIYWALNPDNGDITWSTLVGAGGTLGGIEWGTATDGERIYVAIADSNHVPYTLTSGQQITWGSWSALDVNTGNILWQTADPTAGTIDTGSVSVANGVMYAGSYSGQMYALDTRTGKVLWNFASGGSVIDGPSIVDGTLYWGSGYRNIPPGIGNNKVYAFSLANEKDHGEHSGDNDHSDNHGGQN